MNNVSLLNSVSISVRTSWLFYEQDVLLQFPSLHLFCQASGSKELNWAALAPTYPWGAVTVLLYLASTVGFVNWLTNKATNPHYEQKQALTLKWWGYQKNGESDSWSSSWSGPLIRSGEHGTSQVPLSHPAAPIWSLTSPSPAIMLIPLWLFSIFIAP